MSFFFSVKIPLRKDGILPMQTEGACFCQPMSWSMAAMLRDSTVAVVVVVVVRTRPRAIPLAMIHMRKSIHGFPFVPLYGYGAPLGGLRPPELRYSLLSPFLTKQRYCLISNREGLGTSYQLLIHIVRKSLPRLTRFPSSVLIRLVFTEIQRFKNVQIYKEMYGIWTPCRTASGLPYISL